MPIRLKKHYVHELYLDDDETGTPEKATLHIARLTVDEFSAYDAGMKRLDDPPSLRLLGGRQPGGEEQERRPARTPAQEADETLRAFVLSDETISERRIAELGPDERARYDAANAEDELWAKRFIQDAIEKYISVPAGQILDDDGQDIRTGAELVRYFGGRGDVLKDLIFAIYGENSMSAPLKKIWRSRFASSPGSSEAPSPAEPGPTPAPTAGSAETAASVAIEPATASSDETREASPSPSGEVATLH